MAHLVCSMKLWVPEERVSAGRIDERVLKTPSIVLRSTLSAQNTHQTYPRRKKICLKVQGQNRRKTDTSLKTTSISGYIIRWKIE